MKVPASICVGFACLSALVADAAAEADPRATASPQIHFHADDGGRWSLSFGDQMVVGPARLFRVQADNVEVDRWTSATTEHHLENGVLRLNGPVANAEGLEADVTIVRVGGADCWEFRLKLTNTGSNPIEISRADAWVGRLEGTWRGLSFRSKWGEEWEPETFVVDRSRAFEVRTGRSSLGHHPWVGLVSERSHALAIAPVWSGNWHIALEQTGRTTTALSAGLSPWKFTHTLQPGAVFMAPSVLIAAGADLEVASVELTRAVAATLPRSSASEALPVEWNPWWPYEDKHINETVFLANVDVASTLGIELCTLDAGWFGDSSTGSAWWDVRGDFDRENRARFPHGLTWLADETRRRGQKFGLWVELEAVGLKSKLRHERPELMARRDDAPPLEPLDSNDPGFLGYLCLGSAAARHHARDTLESLTAKTHCAWIKLDFNLDPQAGCSRTDHGHGSGDGLYAHYQGLYMLLDAFRAAHPDIILEACSSGGLRIDAALLRHVHCTFLSDPDWPRHHLQVVHGTSRLLPPAAMLHWANSEFLWQHPQQTFDLQDPALTEEAFDAFVRGCFMHRLGVSWKLPEMPERWRQRFAQHVELYQREIRPFVRAGTLRRLTEMPRREGGGDPFAAFQLTLDDDRHLLLGFALEPGTGNHTLTPAGLSPNVHYLMRSLDFDAPQSGDARTGAVWMDEGLSGIGRQSFIAVLEPEPLR